jgi:predicted nucleic acid-binding protein
MTEPHTTYRIAINDANLLIDLFEIGLIDSFFQLNLEFHTTSLIIGELDQDQQSHLKQFIETERLKIREISILDIETFKDLPVQTRKLSIPDLSLYFYAIELKECMILTGDNRLRKEAEKIGFEVHGVLWVFEELVDKGNLSKTTAVKKLEELIKVNLWLPIRDCEKLIESFKIEIYE